AGLPTPTRLRGVGPPHGRRPRWARGGAAADRRLRRHRLRIRGHRDLYWRRLPVLSPGGAGGPAGVATTTNPPEGAATSRRWPCAGCAASLAATTGSGLPPAVRRRRHSSSPSSRSAGPARLLADQGASGRGL